MAFRKGSGSARFPASQKLLSPQSEKPVPVKDFILFYFLKMKTLLQVTD